MGFTYDMLLSSGKRVVVVPFSDDSQDVHAAAFAALREEQQHNPIVEFVELVTYDDATEEDRADTTTCVVGDRKVVNRESQISTNVE